MAQGSESSPLEGTVVVTLKKAGDLVAENDAGSIDPLVLFGFVSSKEESLRKSKTALKTSTIKNNQNPEWNEKFTLTLPSKAPVLLKFELFDKDPEKGDYLGNVVVKLSKMFDNKRSNFRDPHNFDRLSWQEFKNHVSSANFGWIDDHLKNEKGEEERYRGELKGTLEFTYTNLDALIAQEAKEIAAFEEQLKEKKKKETSDPATQMWAIKVDRFNFGRTPFAPLKQVTFFCEGSILVPALLRKFRECGASSWLDDVELARNVGMKIKVPGEPEEKSHATKVPSIFSSSSKKRVDLPDSYKTKRAVDVGFKPREQPFSSSQIPPGASD